MWEYEQLNFRKKIAHKNKNSNFEFQAPHTKIFKINCNFLAKMCFYILL